MYTNLKSTNKVIVNHAKKEYVNGNTSTNCSENFLGSLKRGIIGIYRVVSSKHLQKYIFELVFRYNTGKMSSSEIFIYLLSNVKGCNDLFKIL